MAVIDRVVVIVPVRDEERTICPCLSSVCVAIERCPVPATVLVVLDSCTDRSELYVRAFLRGLDYRTLTVDHGACNKARAAGALMALAGVDASSTWLATTDADSTVPASWLAFQLAHAEDGVEAVFGAGRIDDWSEWPAGSREAYEREYARSGFTHGFNMGVRGDALLSVGGFSTTLNEDAALRNALLDDGHRVAFDRDIVVTTSARRASFCRTGFAATLASTIERGRRG